MNSSQYAFVRRFFDFPSQRMSRKRFRHWKRQIRRGAERLAGLEPIQTIADHEEFEEHRPYCHRCSNTGSLNCFCGGDFCVCSNNGEYPCPDCYYD